MPDFPIKCANLTDPEYPQILKEIKDPPKLLYYRGDLSGKLTLSKNKRVALLNIAMVGSRRMTNYGRQAVEYLINGLHGLPVCIVSGLAYGVDAHSHEISIKNGLTTWAVLGSGPDDNSIYPRANLPLARKILNSGGAI